MAKKGNGQSAARSNSQRNAPVGGAKASAPQSVSQSPKGLTAAQLNVLLAAVVGVVTYFFLSSCLGNQFTNWDDPGYVTNQPIIKDISSAGIRNIFSLSSSIMGNYHPLTILSYAVDYSISGLDPYSFHLQSLLFHLATTLLVFLFIQLLFRKPIASFVTALLFGLHPMHVESVAWVAGRKDVVYGFFYLASCIVYVVYARANERGRWVWYGGALLLFACSILSKPVAVVLPLTLLLIDFIEGRLWTTEKGGLRMPSLLVGAGDKNYYFNLKALLEKIPYLAISLACGIKSIKDQEAFGALGTQGEHFNFIERIGLGGYALVTYLWKAVAPVNLVCFYPYPLKVSGHLEFVYYIFPVIAAAVVFAFWYFLRKNKMFVFGALFFLVNIVLLLQFIPVGGAIIADRYSYIPYLGLFFALGWFVSSLFEGGASRQLGQIVMAAVIVYSLVLGYLSSERCKVWYDGMSLWRNEIEVEPIRAPNGFNNLGFFYFTKFNGALKPEERKLYFDSSYFLLNRAIELQPSFVNPYISLGELMRANNQFDLAKSYYYKALRLDSSEQTANAYLGLAIVYSITRHDDSAIFSYGRTIALKPYNPEAHSNYANFLDMTGRKEEALKQYGIAVEQNPDIVAPYLNRGRALQRLGRCDEAFKDFNRALSLSPDLGEIYYARSYCYFLKNNKGQALQDVEKARSLGFNQIDNNYYQQLKN